ncbi:SDR family NAD(P)-dependent oxidoreductase [Pseudoxanthomonas suwonensis]|uniref:Aklaviketone reductase n=1 Tax=Pseudoxanthomonas suwonensis TaxID=314722 RepID=A0A0E3Z597_9GAMM|nr:SDR family NAD(P)-dependent oxidoreductase [Pseudoxanthomonas suwonensis]AKC87892.1 aklaviketone reductase [Pseudoxanthomonas suwonensis]
MSGMLAPEVLVLGASGRVGAGIVSALLEAGSPVLAVGRDPRRLEQLAARHADEPALEVLSGSVATERAAEQLAARVARRPRPLRAVVDAIGGSHRSGRLLDRPASSLRRSLDRDLLPRLAAARHLLPLLGGRDELARYVLIGGPQAECGWSGYGHASISVTAVRMLAKVLHEEAQPLGVRLQLLAVDAPVWTSENAAHACAGWPSALAVGRNVVALLAGEGDSGRCVVAYSTPKATPPRRLLACDVANPLRVLAATGDGQAAA